MELVTAGIGWSAGILLYATISRGGVLEREWFAVMMVNAFAVINGVFL